MLDFDIRVAVVGTLFAASILPVEGQIFLVGDNVNVLELVNSWFNLQKTFRICICFSWENTLSLTWGDWERYVVVMSSGDWFHFPGVDCLPAPSSICLSLKKKIKVYTPTLTAQDGRSLTMPKPCGWSSHSFGVVFQGFIPGSDPCRNMQIIGREMYILGDGAKWNFDLGLARG